MSESKKFSCRVVEGESGWTAEIVRKVSSKRSMVSKSKDGFATEDEAKAWGDEELKGFMKNQAERNKRRSEKRG